ncbi:MULTISPECIES: TfoX/Sxy family protein [unclassified Aeromicrobium]|uniref:TfoX/Sxy family protein n=1 Tax=unclassified Aeromicrobium TaxID=2633570 RepID=UPI00396B3B9E
MTESPQEALARRVRHELAGRVTREVTMFGGLSFMVEEALTVAARRDGSLLVRVDPAARAEALGRPGAEPAAMRNGRVMGDGWLSVRSEGVASDDHLRSWLAVALAAAGR